MGLGIVSGRAEGHDKPDMEIWIATKEGLWVGDLWFSLHMARPIAKTCFATDPITALHSLGGPNFVPIEQRKMSRLCQSYIPGKGMTEGQVVYGDPLDARANGSLWMGKKWWELFDAAATKARGARFEHGERG
jgi:hypothetical protein